MNTTQYIVKISISQYQTVWYHNKNFGDSGQCFVYAAEIIGIRGLGFQAQVNQAQSGGFDDHLFFSLAGWPVMPRCTGSITEPTQCEAYHMTRTRAPLDIISALFYSSLSQQSQQNRSWNHNMPGKYCSVIFWQYHAPPMFTAMDYQPQVNFKFTQVEFHHALEWM